LTVKERDTAACLALAASRTRFLEAGHFLLGASMDREADPPWGEVVTILRVIRDWNQRQLADAAEMSPPAISRYEAGGRPAPVRRLAAAMGFPLHLLDRTRSFLRWAKAAREAHLAAGTLALPERIDVFAGELGLWLEDLAREGLAPAVAPPSQEASPAATAAPPWWHKATLPSRRKAGLSQGPRNTPLGQSLIILRVIRGWERPQLADAIGMREPTLDNWERGKARPRTMDVLDRLVEALGFPPVMLGRTLSFVQSARAARERYLAGGDPALRSQAADIAARAAQSFEDFTRQSVTLLAAAARLLDSRCEAPALWERFRACSEPGQLDLAREAAEFQTPGFAELLCEKSRDAAGDSAARALHLAGCAVLVAAAVPGSEGSRSRLEGYARAHLSNADRVGGDLNQADRTLSRGKELWQAGAGDDPGLLNAARVLHLEASLRRDQRRVDEALALIEEALRIDRWDETPTLLMGKARALEELGEHEAAIALLLQAESQLDGERRPRDLFVIRAQLVSNLCRLGRHAEAELALTEARMLAIKLGNQLDLLRVDWLHGQVAAGLGRTDEAIETLGRVRAAFMAQHNAYDTALATLELAEVYASLGRTDEVKALAQESAPVFHDQGVHREARQALELFRRAAEEERVSAELLRSILTYLYRSRHDARVRYEAAA
jgi:transcriptional regulator with XRE-family HTH domain